MKRSYVAIVLDKSSSMSRYHKETVDAYNGILSSIRDGDKNLKDHETRIMLTTFADRANVDVALTPLDAVIPLTTRDYNPYGQTALHDGIGRTTEVLAKAPHGSHKDTSFLVLVITDGEENNSLQYKASDLKRLMGEYQDTGRWTFTLQVPPGRATEIAARFGIPRENVREWETNSQGMRSTQVETQSGIQGYMATRGLGATNSTNFFAKVTTDLSKVDPVKARNSLQNLSSYFRAITVEKEGQVKEIVEAKTKKPYVIGQAYYQLMKKEEIQPNKAILLVEKGSKNVLGGPSARDLIGLPRGQHAKVDPGNHANWDVYVQSTSVNRKLPRGTKVLVDTQQSQHMTPTWVLPPTAAVP